MTLSGYFTGQVSFFIPLLKTIGYDFSNSETFNNWMDTFDLLMKYNKYQKAPLANAYEYDQLTMASDQVAFWPIGNYIYPNIMDINEDAQVGLMPYPMGDDEATFGNKEIVLSYSMFAIDSKQSTPAQQEAAVDFFNWLITSEEGQDSYINTLVFIPIFEGFKVQPTNPVAKQIVTYLEECNTLERMSDYFPAGFMKGVSKEMEEAALIDGCSHFYCFWKIVFPNLKPITTTILIVNILWIWNDFLLPSLVLIKDKNRTIPLSTFYFFGEYTAELGLAMAALILSVLPVVVIYLFLQKQIVTGVMDGAIK